MCVFFSAGTAAWTGPGPRIGKKGSRDTVNRTCFVVKSSSHHTAKLIQLRSVNSGFTGADFQQKRYSSTTTCWHAWFCLGCLFSLWLNPSLGRSFPCSLSKENSCVESSLMSRSFQPRLETDRANWLSTWYSESNMSRFMSKPPNHIKDSRQPA